MHHLLSILLVVKSSYSISINRPLNDRADASIVDAFSSSTENENSFNQSLSSEKNETNLELNRNTKPNPKMAKQPYIYLSKPLPLIAAKVYNKADSRKRKVEDKSVLISPDLIDWKCPNISQSRNLECGCDMPHTLRCSGDVHGLELIAKGLRQSIYSVSLLDCTLKNVSFLSDARIFENVSLHGLVISSGEIKRVHRMAFVGLSSPLQALGNYFVGIFPFLMKIFISLFL